MSRTNLKLYFRSILLNLKSILYIYFSLVLRLKLIKLYLRRHLGTEAKHSRQAKTASAKFIPSKDRSHHTDTYILENMC